MTRDRSYVVTKGQRFGDLVVIDQVPLFKGPAEALCRCVCGKEVPIRVKSLLEGTKTHCGCRRQKREQHGESGTELYKIWTDIRRKDHNKKRIPLFTEWNTFTTFKQWAEFSGYCEGFEIRRFNLLKGHEPFNCYWHQDHYGGNFDVTVGEVGLICTWWFKSNGKKWFFKREIPMQEILTTEIGRQELIFHHRDWAREEVIQAIEREVDSRGLFR